MWREIVEFDESRSYIADSVGPGRTWIVKASGKEELQDDHVSTAARSSLLQPGRASSRGVSASVSADLGSADISALSVYQCANTIPSRAAVCRTVWPHSLRAFCPRMRRGTTGASATSADELLHAKATLAVDTAGFVHRVRWLQVFPVGRRGWGEAMAAVAACGGEGRSGCGSGLQR